MPPEPAPDSFEEQWQKLRAPLWRDEHGNLYRVGGMSGRGPEAKVELRYVQPTMRKSMTVAELHATHCEEDPNG